VLAIFAVVFNVLLGAGGGRTTLLELPRLEWRLAWGGEPVSLLAVGGKVSLESLVYGLSNALALLAVLLALGTFNTLVDHYQLVRRLPAFLDRSATVASIALTFVPQLVEAQREIREAMALRGYRRRLRDLPKLFVVLLGEALERSITLAESMEARGFRRREGASARAARWSKGMVVIGLGLLVGGAFARGYLPESAFGWPLLVGGGLALGLAFHRVGRGVRRSRLRREEWSRRDSWLAWIPLGVAGILVVLWFFDPSAFSYQPYPRVEWPPFAPGIALAVLVTAVPALVLGGRGGR
jgi:energy-coupling factor transport system permease protein